MVQFVMLSHDSSGNHLQLGKGDFFSSPRRVCGKICLTTTRDGNCIPVGVFNNIVAEDTVKSIRCWL